VQIIRTDVPGLTQEPGRRNFVIVDDICDGGRTFLEIAKTIRSKRNISIFGDKIYLSSNTRKFSVGFDEQKTL
jgi:hypoxanthine-guanine phosphoribosyltransferase